MTTTDTQVQIQTEWRKEDGTGSECCACEERAFLFEYRLYIRIAGIEQDWWPTVICACMSCGEGLDQ